LITIRDLYKKHGQHQILNGISAEVTKGDVVVITGKGCEPWICWEGGRKEAWDDRRIVKEEFKKINKI
jgi:UDP-N-acetylmuramyl tripeptide synthase